MVERPRPEKTLVFTIEGRRPRRYVRKLKSGGYGVYSTVVKLHGFYETEDEARRAAKEEA